MNSYLDILKQKAEKIGANIEQCGYDKECIKDILAAKVRSNLENEELEFIKEKALEIQADIPDKINDKTFLLNAIEIKVKKILEEENERFTSIELQQTFTPFDLG
ncbi:MAG: hypothetical protein ACQERD_02735 [Campylobacterota bacterium]